MDGEPRILLLTGANGFTGRHLAAAAAEAGITVHALAADLLDAGAVEREVAQVAPTHALHLAAISHVAHRDEKAFYDVNLFGTLNLLRALEGLARPPQRVLLASSANVYGNAPQSPVGEGACPAPANHYGMSKLAMEHMARRHRLPLVVARPFNYTGPGQHVSFLIPKLVDHYARREPVITLGNTDVEREFNDVRMVCAAYLRLLAQGEPGGVYNICTGRPHALSSVLELLGHMTGHRIEVRQDPALMRGQEVRTLCGDPRRLQALGGLPAHTLQDTLAWMLAQARGGSAAFASAAPRA